MFTGIVQAVARVAAIHERPGLRSLRLALASEFASGLEIGASVACDGVCLTVTALHRDGDAGVTVTADTRPGAAPNSVLFTGTYDGNGDGISQSRNASHPAPPPQIRTCGATAYGSCLGS